MAPTQLEIKVKALQRLQKEQELYRVDLLEEGKVLAQLKNKNTDEYDLRKQTEVLQESERMIEELTRKIKEHKENLTRFVNLYEGNEDLSLAKSLIK